MKPLKALLALAVAMTATSSFAETANPLATFKQEAKTAINNELSSCGCRKSEIGSKSGQKRCKNST